MLEFGKHTSYIIWSYGLSGLTIIALIAYTYIRSRK